MIFNLIIMILYIFEYIYKSIIKVEFYFSQFKEKGIRVGVLDARCSEQL